MAGQSDDEPITTRNRQTRVVKQEEIDVFVTLFKQIKVSNQTTGQNIPVVATQKVNGKHHPTLPSSNVNGVKRHSSTSQMPTAVVPKGTSAPLSTPGDKKTHKRRRPSESS